MSVCYLTGILKYAWMQFWNIIDKGLTRESSHKLTIRTKISSKPWTLLMSGFLIILSISLSSQVMEESLASVLKTTESGIWESLSMGVYWEAKNLLKWLGRKYDTSKQYKYIFWDLKKLLIPLFFDFLAPFAPHFQLIH